MWRCKQTQWFLHQLFFVGNNNNWAVGKQNLVIFHEILIGMCVSNIWNIKILRSNFPIWQYYKQISIYVILNENLAIRKYGHGFLRIIVITTKTGHSPATLSPLPPFQHLCNVATSWKRSLPVATSRSCHRMVFLIGEFFADFFGGCNNFQTLEKDDLQGFADFLVSCLGIRI